MRLFKRTLESYKIKHKGFTPNQVKARHYRKRANAVNHLMAKAGILTRIKPFVILCGTAIKSELKFEEIK